MDTSVLLRFFIQHDDRAQAGAERLREAFVDGRTVVVLLDLSIYEFVNVQTRRLKIPPSRVTAHVEALFDMATPISPIGRSVALSTASISLQTGLSGYDAAFVATASSAAVPLVTTDRSILTAAPDCARDLASFAH